MWPHFFHALVTWLRFFVISVSVVVGISAGILLSVPETLAAPAGMGPAPAVLEARIGHHETVTRLVIALSERVSYDVFTLADPDRVVVDLPAVRWQVAPDAEPRPSGLIDGLRHGSYKTDVSRLVIDCREPVIVRETGLIADQKGQYRLFIDVSTASQAPTAPGIDSAVTASVISDSAAGSDSALGPVIGRTELPGGDGPPLLVVGEPPARNDLIVGKVATARAAVAHYPPPRQRPAPYHFTPWVVAIDAGHGGVDPGAISLNGEYEKRITLAVARALRDRLNALGRYKVVMTRDRDVFIRLRDRIAIARAAGANLFISLHADKMANTLVRGLSVYTLSERASDAEAAALAEQENRSDLLAGVNLGTESPEVTNILIDLVQRESMNQSSVLAAGLVRELREQTLLLPKTHRFAGFAVLKAPDVPSALVELGYLSNPADERLLRSDQHRRKLAAAIARAIDAYFVRVEARNRQ